MTPSMTMQVAAGVGSGVGVGVGRGENAGVGALVAMVDADGFLDARVVGIGDGDDGVVEAMTLAVGVAGDGTDVEVAEASTDGSGVGAEAVGGALRTYTATDATVTSADASRATSRSTTHHRRSGRLHVHKATTPPLSSIHARIGADT